MDKSPKAAIDAHVRQITESLEGRMADFMSELQLEAVISDSEREVIVSESPKMEQMWMLLNVLKIKSNGWNSLTKYLRNNGGEKLAQSLENSAGEPTIDRQETPETATETRRCTKSR